MDQNSDFSMAEAMRLAQTPAGRQLIAMIQQQNSSAFRQAMTSAATGNYQQAQELLVQKSADALLPGGHVLIDYGYTLHPEYWFNNPNPNLVWQGTDTEGNSGKMILLNNTYDCETGIARFIRRFEMTLADGSELIKEIPNEKHFPHIEQVHGWLERHGFVIENQWGDYNRNPISEDTHRAIIWAKKL